jgi:uncharacterized protein (TIGR03437 family)
MNALSPTASLSPGVLAIVTGANFGTDKTVVSVTMGGKHAFLLFAGNTQLNVQIPVELQPGTMSVVVTSSGAASAPFNITLAAYSPGLVAAQDSKTALLLGDAGSPVMQVKPGDIVTAFADGLGGTNPPAVTGSPAAGSLSACVTTPQFTLGGVGGMAGSCALAPNQVGLYQVTLKIPVVPAGAQALVLTIGGVSSPRLTVNVGAAPAPNITNIANAASNIGYNSPIASGAIFVLYGTGMGPQNISIASAPFQSTNLSGTSVAVTVGTITVNALLYYTSDTQVAALLPSNTPAGAANFTVTYNDQTSTPHTHGVGSNNLGIFTVDSSGQGAAIVTYADYSLVSPVKAANCGGPSTTCGAANPGDTLILWGTGLGPVNGSDAAGAGLGQNMPNVPLTVWLGGVKAPVVYQGRSGCCIGEDQVVFTIPDTVPTGCAVPLTVQIGTNTSTISNTALLAVAKGSRNCTPVNPELAAISSAALEQLITSGNPARIANLNLTKSPNGAGFNETSRFQFFKITGYVPGTQSFFLSFIDDPPVGTCVVYSNSDNSNDFPVTGVADLSAGSSFTITGPNGTMMAPPNSINGSGRNALSSSGTFLVPGNYTVTGTGGADIGAFTSSFSVATVPNPIAPANNSTIARASGMTVTWTPAASGNVQIQVVSATDQNYNVGFTTQCVAPASAGSFSIPAYALLPHFAGNFSYYEIYSSVTTPFTATGADFAAAKVRIDGQTPGIILQ